MGKVDLFLEKVFFWSKYLSAGIVGLCCLVLVGLSFSLLGTWFTSFNVPRFSVIEESFKEEASSQRPSQDYRLFDEKRKVEKEYGDEIQKIVKKFNFSPSSYDVLVRDLVNIPDKWRRTYLDGLKNFLKEAKKFREKHADAPSLPQAANFYRDMFFAEIERAKAEKEAAGEKRLFLLAGIGVTILVLLAFLLVPLLVKIEENTRRISR